MGDVLIRRLLVRFPRLLRRPSVHEQDLEPLTAPDAWVE